MGKKKQSQGVGLMNRRAGLQYAIVHDPLGAKVFIRIESIPVPVKKELVGVATRCRLPVNQAFGFILEVSLDDLIDLIDLGERRAGLPRKNLTALGLHIPVTLKERLWNAVKMTNSKRHDEDRVGFGVAAGLVLVALKGGIADAIVEGMTRRISGGPEAEDCKRGV